jgi:hypothetical protein
MNRSIVLMATFSVACFGAFAGAQEGNCRQGLFGAWYHGPDLTRIGGGMGVFEVMWSWSGQKKMLVPYDGGTWDLGHPRMVQRPDGKVVTICYSNSEEVPAQDIAATIWDADRIR